MKNVKLSYRGWEIDVPQETADNPKERVKVIGLLRLISEINNEKGKWRMGKIHEKYITKLDELEALILADFEYYREENSRIDRRLNELGKRGDIEATAEEMEELLIKRKVIKDASVKMLPLRDFFKNNYREVHERLERSEVNRK